MHTWIQALYTGQRPRAQERVHCSFQVFDQLGGFFQTTHANHHCLYGTADGSLRQETSQGGTSMTANLSSNDIVYILEDALCLHGELLQPAFWEHRESQAIAS